MPQKSLSARDADLALSVASPKERKTGRKRRCINCGLMYSLDELNPERDDEERIVGLICDGCY
jgi:hypothetical protein